MMGVYTWPLIAPNSVPFEHSSCKEENINVMYVSRLPSTPITVNTMVWYDELGLNV